MPISEHLHKFVDSVERLEQEDYHGENGFYREFQELRQMSLQLSHDDVNYPRKNGKKEGNKKKNRYKDILPFDETRVILPVIDGDPDSDYINANYIKGVNGLPEYIASQGPLPASVNDFWRMLWYNNVEVVAMACKEFEMGKHKCQRYWAGPDERKMFGDITVELEQEKHISSDFVLRILHVSSGGESRTVFQFHYNAWPDHGVPTTFTPIFDMITLMKEYRSNIDIPMVIHCSAGCGRTGTICAIDYAWTLLKMGRVDDSFSLFNIVASMRKQRPSIVQAAEQYKLVYEAVKELFERHLDIIKRHTYQNVNFGSSNQPTEPPGIYENFVPHGNMMTPGEEEEQDNSDAPSDSVIRKTSINLLAIDEGSSAPLSSSQQSDGQGAPPPKPPLAKKPSVDSKTPPVKTPSSEVIGDLWNAAKTRKNPPPSKPPLDKKTTVGTVSEISKPSGIMNSSSSQRPSKVSEKSSPGAKQPAAIPPMRKETPLSVDSSWIKQEPKPHINLKTMGNKNVTVPLNESMNKKEKEDKPPTEPSSPSVNKLRAVFQSEPKGGAQAVQGGTRYSPGERRKFSLDTELDKQKVQQIQKRHTLHKSFQPSLIKVEKATIPPVLSQSNPKNVKVGEGIKSSEPVVERKPNKVTVIRLGSGSDEAMVLGNEYTNVTPDSRENLQRIEEAVAASNRSGIIDVISSTQPHVLVSLKPTVKNSKVNIYEEISPVETAGEDIPSTEYAYSMNPVEIRGPALQLVHQKKVNHENLVAGLTGNPSAPPRRNAKRNNSSTSSEDLYQEVNNPDNRGFHTTRQGANSDDEMSPPMLPEKTPFAYKPFEDVEHDKEDITGSHHSNTISHHSNATKPSLQALSTTLKPGLHGLKSKIQVKLQNPFKRTDAGPQSVFHDNLLTSDEKRIQKGSSVADISLGFGTRGKKPVGPKKQPIKWSYTAGF